MNARTIYLASPFGSDRIMQIHNYEAVKKTTAGLLKDGFACYSPIVHSFWLAEHYLHDWQKFEHWQFFDFAMIERLECLGVLMLPGWKTSIGVQKEIEYAKSLEKKILYFEPM